MIVGELTGVFSTLAEPVIDVLTADVPTPQGLIAFFGTGANQVVHDGSAFVAPYTRSTREAIMGGYRYTVRRDGEWYAPVKFVSQRLSTETIDSLVSRSSPNDAVEFSITEATEQVAITTTYADGSKELVFDGYNFTFFFQGVSTYEFTDDDPDFVHEFSLRRVGGWPGASTTVSGYSTGIIEPVAPEITSTPPSLTGLESGDAFPTYTVTATGYPAVTFSATGLPTGVSLSSGGVFSGNITNAGSYTITITATNGVSPDDTQILNFTVASSYSPLDLSPVLWLDAANFDGTDWTDSSGNGNDFTGTASVSTDGSEGYAAVSFNGTSDALTGPSWDTIFGGSSTVAGVWEIVICFRPNTLSLDVEGIRDDSRAGLTMPQLFGCGLRGVALMRSATRAHSDGKEATRRPRASTWEESTGGNGSHKHTATPIKESQTQITRHGRSGTTAFAAGYKNASVVGSGDDATLINASTCVIGGSSSGRYSGKISHILAFDRKLSDAEAAELAAWLDAQVGVDHLPYPLDGEVAATMIKIDMDAADPVGLNDGVVDIDVGVAWDVGSSFFPMPPIGWEMYTASQRPDLVTIGAHNGLRFVGTSGDHAFPTSSTAYSYPGSYAEYKALFGPQEGMGCCVLSLEQFNTTNLAPLANGTIFGWLSLPYSNQGLQYRKDSGVPVISFFDAETTALDTTIFFVEFGLKTVSGNTVAHIRVNNGAVVKYTHAGLVDLSAGDLIGLGSRDGLLSNQHVLYRMRTCVDAQSNAAQQKWRDIDAADFGLTLATTDLFA